MEKDGLIESTQNFLDERRNANTFKQADSADRRLIKVLKDIETKGGVSLAFEAFDVIISDTAKYHINDPEMEQSVRKSVKELGLAQETLEKVYHPDTYRCVAEEHRGDKTVINGRPKDQVHQFLSSHMARLRNECKGMSSDARKGLLNAQSICLKHTKEEYEKLQDKAMGREPEPTKRKSKGLER